jgi:hypothetical protein
MYYSFLIKYLILVKNAKSTSKRQEMFIQMSHQLPLYLQNKILNNPNFEELSLLGFYIMLTTEQVPTFERPSYELLHPADASNMIL